MKILFATEILGQSLLHLARLLFICVFLLSCAYAQTVDPNPNNGQQRAQDVQNFMQQQLQLDQERILQDSSQWSGGEELIAPKNLDEKKFDGNCTIINRIYINGASILNAQDLVRMYEGRCLGAQDLEQMLALITGAYVSRGFVTSRAYLPEQSIAEGVLLIEVLEGQIEDFRIEGLSADHKNINLSMSFPTRANNILNLRDLEQGIDQVNALQSNQAAIQIIPGGVIGKSIVSIANKPRPSWRSSISYDNSGQKATGKDQFGISASLDSPTGFGDSLRGAYQTSDPKYGNAGYSNLASINYSIPFGYSTFSFGYLTTAYQQVQILASGSKYFSNGFAHNAFGQYTFVAYRDHSNKLSISTALTQKESKNYFAGYFLSINSPTLSVMDIDLSIAKILRGWGSANLGLGFTQGLDEIGATNNFSIAGSPQAQYKKYRQSIAFNLSRDFGPVFFAWGSQTTAQQTSNILYGSEQFSVIGPYTVRGFSNNYLSGNSGFYSRNDFNFQRAINFLGNSAFLKLYAGLDVGSTFIPDADFCCSTLVSSATAGLTLNISKYAIDLSFSKPLKTLSWMLPESGLAYLRLKYDINPA